MAQNPQIFAAFGGGPPRMRPPRTALRAGGPPRIREIRGGYPPEEDALLGTQRVNGAPGT
mgnify:CR=1 FL=1